MKLCDYGCGQEAKYQFKNGKWCCNDDHRKCPFLIEQIRKKNVGKKRSAKFKEDTSNRMKGKNNHMFGTGGYWKGKKRSKKDVEKFRISHKQSIEDIQQKYPLFSKIEEMRYNPDKPIKEKEIQVHCKYYDCENSKEKNGWFTPTYTQLYERIRALDRNGVDHAYLYCSQQCRELCPGYCSDGTDPFKETELPYTQEEYNLWKQTVLEQDNYKCQKCGSKENLHCHHIIPVKENEMLVLDPDNGIVLCQKCHYEIGHKSGTECSTGNLAHKSCQQTRRD